MDQARIKYLVDIGMGISFLIVFITGIFKFPGLARRFFIGVYQVVPAFYLAKIHDWSGVVMGAFVLVHLVLNWNWIVSMTKNMFKKRH